jgi:hypothetical protein
MPASLPGLDVEPVRQRVAATIIDGFLAKADTGYRFGNRRLT